MEKQVQVAAAAAGHGEDGDRGAGGGHEDVSAVAVAVGEDKEIAVEKMDAEEEMPVHEFAEGTAAAADENHTVDVVAVEDWLAAAVEQMSLMPHNPVAAYPWHLSFKH